MPTAKELMIRWEMPAVEIIRLINACNPWNKGAGAIVNNWMIGVTEAVLCGETDDPAPPGIIISCDEKNGLQVKTVDSKLLKITIVYLQEGFYSGYRLSEFDIQPGMCFQ